MLCKILVPSRMWWKFYIEHDFPFMYGLLLLESECKRTGSTAEDLSKAKKEFKEKYIAYFETNNIFYMEHELSEISELEMIDMFRNVLLREFNNYEDNEVVKDIVKIAIEIREEYFS